MLNLTPQAISVQLPDGSTVTFPPSGQVARVSMIETHIASMDGIPCIARKAGSVEGLPDGNEPCLVSSMVLDACSTEQAEMVFAPDTGSTAIRNGKGHVVAVTRLVQKGD